jgi:acetolactate synthase-1/2/3 large subunit
MGAFQELDQIAMAAPVTKGAWLAQRPEDVPGLVQQALEAMLSGRPGPACLALPADVLTQPTEVEVGLPGGYESEASLADPAAVKRAAHWLSQAERPLVLAGPSFNWGEARRARERLAEASGCQTFVLESPRGLADPSLQGVGAAFREADLVILAAPQDFVAGFASPSALASAGRLIELSPTEASSGQNRPPDLALIGQPRAVMEQLASALARPAQSRAGWRARLAELRAAGRALHRAAEESEEQLLHPLRVCAAVRERLGADDIVVEDGGEFGQWARWAFGDSRQRALVNGKLGMIGCGLPMALGAQVADPRARVVVFVGDGTFGFHGFELDTAVRHKLPIIAVVGHDAGWAAERHRQLAFYGPDRLVAADLLDTRYDEVAKALGAEGELVERPEQLEGAVERALASGRPYCVNVRIASVPSPAAAAAK